MSGFRRPSDAGPMLAPPASQLSSSGLLLLPWLTPPTENTFLAHACGREFWLPVLLWLCVHGMSWSNTMSSASAETDVYAIVCASPHDAVVWCTLCVLTSVSTTCQRELPAVTELYWVKYFAQ